MPGFKETQSADARLAACLARPRFLRVIPSLVVLTTALAWGASMRADGAEQDSGLRGATEVSAAAGYIDRAD